MRRPKYDRYTRKELEALVGAEMFARLRDSGLKTVKRRYREEDVISIAESASLVESQEVSDMVPVVHTAEQLAQIMTVTPVAVQYWQRKPDFPGRPGHYPVQEIMAWYQSDLGRPKRAQVPDENSAENRYKRAKAETAELNLLERRGELVSKELFIADLARKTSRVNAVDAATPDRIAARLAELKIDPDVILDVRELLIEAMAETQRLRSQAILGEEEDEDLANAEDEVEIS